MLVSNNVHELLWIDPIHTVYAGSLEVLVHIQNTVYTVWYEYILYMYLLQLNRATTPSGRPTYTD